MGSKETHVYIHDLKHADSHPNLSTRTRTRASSAVRHFTLTSNQPILILGSNYDFEMWQIVMIILRLAGTIWKVHFSLFIICKVQLGLTKNKIRLHYTNNNITQKISRFPITPKTQI